MRKPLLLATSMLASSLFSAFFGICWGANYLQVWQQLQPATLPWRDGGRHRRPQNQRTKTQAEQATQRDAKLASELEKSRLQKEKTAPATAWLARHRPKTNRLSCHKPKRQPSRIGRIKSSMNSSPATSRRRQPGSQVKKPAKTQRSEKASADSG